MLTKREAVLAGTLEAARLHKEFGTEERLTAAKDGWIDVFEMIAGLGIFLVFKQLDGLLGAYLPASKPGVLVTTQRGLAVQRYTAAHELGHHVLSHQVTLDQEEMLNRSPFGAIRYTPQEVSADTFAAMLLMPDWLFNYHAQQQDWSADDIQNPEIVYQFALRLGTSYESTCRMLKRHGFASKGTEVKLLGTAPSEIKKAILQNYRPPTWHPNVWILTDRDANQVIHAEPNDVFIFRLKEHSGAGYLWNHEQAKAAGFEVVADDRIIPSTVDEFGGPIERIVTATLDAAGKGVVDFVEVKPWDEDDRLTQLSFNYDVRAREQGLAVAMRKRVVAA